MTLQTQYEKGRNQLLTDSDIVAANREFFKEFFKQEEYKLIRSNGMQRLDESSYKTLLSYISKFRNLNVWFKGKDLHNITKEDIKKVYDDLEDGKLLNRLGKPFKDRQSIYNKIFRSKPFEMLGKAEIAREIMEFYKGDEYGEVRFIREGDFRKIADVAISPEHKALLWLAFDIGENINALLRLRKGDLSKVRSESSKEYEYYVNLRKETLKRARTPRTEITNYPETVKFLDLILADREDNGLVFEFKYGQAAKVLERAVKITGIKVEPKKDGLVTWKDLRSSMACDLLLKDWTTDEINARLGHRPSSKEIDKYVSFLAIDKKKPRKKIYENNLTQLSEELETSKNNEKLLNRRVEALQEENETFRKWMSKIELKMDNAITKIKRS